MKTICNKHEQAYDVQEGCPYCEKTTPVVKSILEHLIKTGWRVDPLILEYLKIPQGLLQPDQKILLQELERSRKIR